jgi:uncharacterized protein (DUF697 family)
MAKPGDAIIYGAASTLAVVGFFNPVPLLDAVFILGTWAGMLTTLAGTYGVEFNAKAFMTLLKQILLSIGAYALGVLSFLTVIKWTGIGTLPAAIANAGLNFTFTWAVGNLYREAWAEGREPASDEIEQRLKRAVDAIKASMARDNRAKLKQRYEELRKQGIDQKDALLKVLMEEFGTDS